MSMYVKFICPHCNTINYLINRVNYHICEKCGKLINYR